MRPPSATFRVPVPLLPTWIPLSVPWMLTTEPLPVTVSVPSLPSRWPIFRLLEPPLSPSTSYWAPLWTASRPVAPALPPPSRLEEPPLPKTATQAEPLSVTAPLPSLPTPPTAYLPHTKTH